MKKAIILNFVLLTALSATASAQSVLGKTLKFTYTYEFYAKIAKQSASGPPVSGTIYISSKGQVFDYNQSGGATGAVSRSGQLANAQTQTTWHVRGNQLIATSGEGAKLITTITVQGDGCIVRIATTDREIGAKITSQSCTVSSGPPPQ